jgi:hypothetical protein
MINPIEEYNDDANYNKNLVGADFIEEELYGNLEGESYFDGDDIIDDLDFSNFKGKDFKSKLKKVNRTIEKKHSKSVTKNPIGGSSGNARVEKGKGAISGGSGNAKVGAQKGGKDFYVKKRAVLYGKKTGNSAEAENTKRIIVPSAQKVIVEGVDKFILNDDDCSAKNIGYYKCKKLKELIFTINNDSANDLNLNLFDPSQPLDYLFQTSGNLNNKVQVAGGIVQYSDVLFNILGNPMHIPNAKLTFAAPTSTQLQAQINQPFIFKNKSSTGEQVIEPLQLQLQVDNMQVANDIVFFDLAQLNRPFIPNGMDVIQYKVLAGSTVTFAFFYRQRDLRRFFYEEARNNKKLL